MRPRRDSLGAAASEGFVMLTWAIVYLLTKIEATGNAGCLLALAIVADVGIAAIVGATVYFVFTTA